MKEIKMKTFDEIVSNADSVKLKFHELFHINCKKCGSDDVEFWGDYDDSGCYYPGEVGDMIFVVKCHACGNAKVFKEYGHMSKEKIDW